ncbi:MAG: 16S rRNA (uracil(1498)-N(3))-methyltransferase [Verrucomicrobiota bacterium]|jgi:16S rRNA (uracil1498-N3)-methyltransferase|nr:16S rRNA (uracil(1498)-N(3))-methyltransferase [Verrucomicrobiota bacterium]
MHRQLVTAAELSRDTLTLDREASRHLLTVLRVKPGARVQLFDGHGRTREAMVAAVEKHGLALAAAGTCAAHPRPVCAVTLFVCVIKGARMDWTVEKATELGAARIVPVVSERTVARPADSSRWQRIAEEAARQCGSAWLPEIPAPLPFTAALPLVARAAPVFVAALTPGARPLRHALAAQAAPPQQAGWFVGPEGDFTPAELDALAASGAIPVSLGPLVLRAETACLYGLCALSCAASPPQ